MARGTCSWVLCKAVCCRLALALVDELNCGAWGAAARVWANGRSTWGSLERPKKRGYTREVV